MDCNKTQELLNAYVDKELSKSDTTLVEAHLAECSSCRAELEDIRRLDACVASTVVAPDSVRSKIADKLEAARTASPRMSLKEMLGMRTRIGFAAIIAAALIVVGVLATGGNAQAAYARMKAAVTRVTSSHLHIEINAPLDIGVDPSDLKDLSDAKDGDGDNSAAKDVDPGRAMAAATIGSMIGGGTKSIDVWSQGNKWKADAFGKFQVMYADDFVTLVMDGKVFLKVKADKNTFPADFGTSDPSNMTDFLFKNLTKATDEMKAHANVRDMGSVSEDGRTLQELEVTGLEDKGDHFRMLYFVDRSTNLPARFQVYARDEKDGKEKLVVTITCDYNETYPDSMFEVGADKP